MKIRFDYQATYLGLQGGHPFQETEWDETEATEWEAAKDEVRAIAVSRFKPVNTFDQRYLQGIVLINENRTYAFVSPYAPKTDICQTDEAIRRGQIKI